MLRLARVVVPGAPQHMTQRGKRCQEGSGQVWGSERFVRRCDRLLGRVLRRHKPGPQGPWKHKHRRKN